MKTLEEQLDIRLYQRQGLSRRQIARKLGCDPRTVKRYAEHPELMGKSRKCAPRASKVDAYRDQIKAYVQDPEMRSTTIYDKLTEQGFSGGYEIVKRAVRTMRADQQQLAYVRFETEPGAQAQVDLGEFVVQMPDGTIKKYYLLAMILGYSRMLYAELLERCDMLSFLEAHQRAFLFLGGVPEEILYDRMRNVFLRQVVGKVEFTQALMELAVHFGFTPRVAPAYAPWVKGKIERPFDFIREGFWRGYGFGDLDMANRDLTGWLVKKADRVHGTTHERVDVRYQREKPHLLALPPSCCDVSLRLLRQVRKDCTIAVLGNAYVVAHTLVGKSLTVRLSHTKLRIFDGNSLVVGYDIPEGKGKLVQEPRFYQELLADKKMQARKFARTAKKQKARATISPSKPGYPVDVQERSLSDYSQLGGEVSYA